MDADTAACPLTECLRLALLSPEQRHDIRSRLSCAFRRRWFGQRVERPAVLFRYVVAVHVQGQRIGAMP